MKKKKNQLWVYALVAVVALILLGLASGPLIMGYFEFGEAETEEMPGEAPASSGYAAEVEQPEEEETPEAEAVVPVEPPEMHDTPEEMLEWFMLVQMMDENGGVRNEYANGRPYILAETMGQMMEYALRVDNQELFDVEWNFVKENMISEEYGLVRASIWADDYSPRENASNTDDDMRILWALYEAEEKWGPGHGYKAGGKAIADQMVEYNQYMNIMSKGISWDENSYEINHRMDIDDLRWEVMQALANEDAIWRVMVVKTNAQFLTCQDQTNGLFWQEYDIEKSRAVYPVGKDECRTSHMLRAGMYYSDYKTYVPATTLHNKMKQEWEGTGKISSGYKMENLGTGNGIEEMETYALAGRNAIRLGDCDFAIEMKERILLEQVGDTDSPIYGSVSRNRKENGVEDDMDTLLLLEELKTCKKNQ
ncbi:hypothetical protein GF412_05255 [Candidatus Micrarchaeota archaeon]|nr:hypothetical protein [Candidatus Micrarchaeota archaeon]MBD3418361.1 hypothetical protein [Candidatus Micrarchaeota archaeon]